MDGSRKGWGLRILCLAILQAIIGFCSTTPVLAQLRTGREVRDFYHEDIDSKNTNQYETTPGRRTVKNRSNGQADVVTVSYVDDQTLSIIDGQANETPSSTAPNSIASNSMAPNEIVHSGEGLVSGDCESCGVSGGCDDFGTLAPTCANYSSADSCFQGGLLSSLAQRLRCASYRVEVPLFWRRAAGPPALVTSAPVGTAEEIAGQLGQSSTQRLLGGGGPISDELQVGFRLTMGTWLTADRLYGLQFRYWMAGDKNDNFSFTDTDFPILARPFLNTTTATAAQDTQVIAYPNTKSGGIAVSSTSRLYGLNLLIRRAAYQDRFSRIDWLYGYQHIGLRETLGINTNTTVIDTTDPLLGSSIAVSDNFRTSNDFNGVVYGLMSSRRFGGLTLESTVRLGVGNLRRTASAVGSTVTTSADGSSASSNQGLLARNTNSQPVSDNTIVVVPEVGINVAYCLRQNLQFNVGYNYMLVPKVAQASQQLDPRLASNLSDPLTGSLDPTLNLQGRNYWIHGLGLGLQWNY